MDFNEARDDGVWDAVSSAGHTPMQTIFTLLQTDNLLHQHSVTQFLQARCFSWRPINNVKAHTHTRLTALCLGLPRWAGTRKVKHNLDFTGARDSEWQWHQLGMCKSAPRSRQITMPAPHHSVFLQAGCPSCRPTNSVKALKANWLVNLISIILIKLNYDFNFC